VEQNGRHYFLYHGYDAQSTVFTGREGLLQEFRFTPDGWIEFVTAPGTVNRDAAPRIDRFRGRDLPLHWEWNVFQKPQYTVGKGELKLGALTTAAGHFAGQKTKSGNYTATAVIRPLKSTAAAGIAILGDEQNTLTLYLEGSNLRLAGVQAGRDTTWASVAMPARRKLRLRVSAQGGNQFVFSYSANGRSYVPVNATPVNGSYLPPWDRALRVGLAAKGQEGTKAVFDRFDLDSE